MLERVQEFNNVRKMAKNVTKLSFSSPFIESRKNHYSIISRHADCELEPCKSLIRLELESVGSRVQAKFCKRNLQIRMLCKKTMHTLKVRKAY
jgi:hypothetical protein